MPEAEATSSSQTPSALPPNESVSDDTVSVTHTKKKVVSFAASPIDSPSSGSESVLCIEGDDRVKSKLSTEPKSATSSAHRVTNKTVIKDDMLGPPSVVRSGQQVHESKQGTNSYGAFTATPLLDAAQITSGRQPHKGSGDQSFPLIKPSSLIIRTSSSQSTDIYNPPKTTEKNPPLLEVVQDVMEVEEEVISETVNLGSDEFLETVEEPQHQPTKRVSLAEYKRRRSTMDDVPQVEQKAPSSNEPLVNVIRGPVETKASHGTDSDMDTQDNTPDASTQPVLCSVSGPGKIPSGASHASTQPVLCSVSGPGKISSGAAGVSEVVRNTELAIAEAEKKSVLPLKSVLSSPSDRHTSPVTAIGSPTADLPPVSHGVSKEPGPERGKQISDPRIRKKTSPVNKSRTTSIDKQDKVVAVTHPSSPSNEDVTPPISPSHTAKTEKVFTPSPLLKTSLSRLSSQDKEGSVDVTDQSSPAAQTTSSSKAPEKKGGEKEGNSDDHRTSKQDKEDSLSALFMSSLAKFFHLPQSRSDKGSRPRDKRRLHPKATHQRTSSQSSANPKIDPNTTRGQSETPPLPDTPPLPSTPPLPLTMTPPRPLPRTPPLPPHPFTDGPPTMHSLPHPRPDHPPPLPHMPHQQFPFQPRPWFPPDHRIGPPNSFYRPPLIDAPVHRPPHPQWDPMGGFFPNEPFQGMHRIQQQTFNHYPDVEESLRLPRRPRSRSISRSWSSSRSRSRSRSRSSSRSRSPHSQTHSPFNDMLVKEFVSHVIQNIGDGTGTRTKNTKDHGAQTSLRTTSRATQSGPGFKFNNSWSQTPRPPRVYSHAVQCNLEPRTYNKRVQTEPTHTRQNYTQTYVRTRDGACQTKKMNNRKEVLASFFKDVSSNLGGSGPDEEITSLVQTVVKKFSIRIGLDTDILSDYDTASMSMSSDEEVSDNDSGSQPSPVVSGASNISEGDLSDLLSISPDRGSNKYSGPADNTVANDNNNMDLEFSEANDPHGSEFKEAKERSEFKDVPMTIPSDSRAQSEGIASLPSQQLESSRCTEEKGSVTVGGFWDRSNIAIPGLGDGPIPGLGDEPIPGLGDEPMPTDVNDPQISSLNVSIMLASSPLDLPHAPCSEAVPTTQLTPEVTMASTFPSRTPIPFLEHLHQPPMPQSPFPTPPPLPPPLPTPSDTELESAFKEREEKEPPQPQSDLPSNVSSRSSSRTSSRSRSVSYSNRSTPRSSPEPGAVGGRSSHRQALKTNSYSSKRTESKKSSEKKSHSSKGKQSSRHKRSKFRKQCDDASESDCQDSYNYPQSLEEGGDSVFIIRSYVHQQHNFDPRDETDVKMSTNKRRKSSSSDSGNRCYRKRIRLSHDSRAERRSSTASSSDERLSEIETQDSAVSQVQMQTQLSPSRQDFIIPKASTLSPEASTSLNKEHDVGDVQPGLSERSKSLPPRDKPCVDVVIQKESTEQERSLLCEADNINSNAPSKTSSFSRSKSTDSPQTGTPLPKFHISSESLTAKYKKKPILTAAELLAKVRAKKSSAEDKEIVLKGAPENGDQTKNSDLAPSVSKGRAKEVPEKRPKDEDESDPGNKSAAIDMRELMANFHKHMDTVRTKASTRLPSTRTETGPPSLQTETGLPSTQTETRLPSRQTETGLPSRQTETGLPSTQTETRLPSRQTETGLPSTQAETGLPSTQTETGPPSTQTETGLPSTQTETGPPSTQTETGLPSTQTETGLPSTQTETGLPSTQTETGLPSTQTETGPPSTQTDPPCSSGLKATPSLVSGFYEPISPSDLAEEDSSADTKRNGRSSADTRRSSANGNSSTNNSLVQVSNETARPKLLITPKPFLINVEGEVDISLCEGSAKMIDMEICEPDSSPETLRGVANNQTSQLHDSFISCPDVSPVSPDHLDVTPVSPDHLDVTPVSPEHTDVTPVSPEHTDVTPVSPEHTDVTPVSPDHLDVTPVSPDHLDVTPVSPEHTDVSPVSPEHTDVSPVSPDHLDVTPVSPDHLDVTPVSPDHTDVTPVSSEHTDVSPVSPDHLDVTPVSPDHLDVTPVSPDHLDVTPVSPEHTDVTPVSPEHTDVTPVSPEHTDVSPVSPDHLDVTPVSPDHLDVTPVSPEHTDVTPVSPEHTDVTPVSPEHTDVTPVSPEHTDVTPVSPEHTDVTPVSPDHLDVFPVSPEHTDITPVSPEHTDITLVGPEHTDVFPASREHTDVTPASSEHTNLTLVSPEHTDVTPVSPECSVSHSVSYSEVSSHYPPSCMDRESIFSEKGFSLTAVENDQPGKVVEEGALVNDQPAKGVEEGTLVNDQPGKGVEEGVLVNDQPAKVVEEGALMNDQPAKVVEEGALVNDQPAKVVEEGVLVNDQPAKVVEEGTLEEGTLVDEVLTTSSQVKGSVCELSAQGDIEATKEESNHNEGDIEATKEESNHNESFQEGDIEATKEESNHSESFQEGDIEATKEESNHIESLQEEYKSSSTVDDTSADTCIDYLVTTNTGLVGMVTPTTDTGLVDMVTPATDTGLVDTVTPATDAGLVDTVTPVMDAVLIDTVTPATDAGLVDTVTPATDAGLVDMVTPATDAGLVDTVTPVMDAGLVDMVTPAASTSDTVEVHPPLTPNTSTSIDESDGETSEVDEHMGECVGHLKQACDLSTTSTRCTASTNGLNHALDFALHSALNTTLELTFNTPHTASSTDTSKPPPSGSPSSADTSIHGDVPNTGTCIHGNVHMSDTDIGEQTDMVFPASQRMDRSWSESSSECVEVLAFDSGSEERVLTRDLNDSVVSFPESPPPALEGSPAPSATAPLSPKATCSTHHSPIRVTQTHEVIDLTQDSPVERSSPIRKKRRYRRKKPQSRRRPSKRSITVSDRLKNSWLMSKLSETIQHRVLYCYKSTTTEPSEWCDTDDSDTAVHTLVVSFPLTLLPATYRGEIEATNNERMETKTTENSQQWENQDMCHNGNKEQDEVRGIYPLTIQDESAESVNVNPAHDSDVGPSNEVNPTTITSADSRLYTMGTTRVEPLVNSPEPVMAIPLPLVTSPQPVFTNPQPLMAIPQPVVSNRQPLLAGCNSSSNNNNVIVATTTSSTSTNTQPLVTNVLPIPQPLVTNHQPLLAGCNSSDYSIATRSSAKQAKFRSAQSSLEMRNPASKNVSNEESPASKGTYKSRNSVKISPATTPASKNVSKEPRSSVNEANSSQATTPASKSVSKEPRSSVNKANSSPATTPASKNVSKEPRSSVNKANSSQATTPASKNVSKEPRSSVNEANSSQATTPASKNVSREPRSSVNEANSSQATTPASKNVSKEPRSSVNEATSQNSVKISQAATPASKNHLISPAHSPMMTTHPIMSNPNLPAIPPNPRRSITPPSLFNSRSLSGYHTRGHPYFDHPRERIYSSVPTLSSAHVCSGYRNQYYHNPRSINEYNPYRRVQLEGPYRYRLPISEWDRLPRREMYPRY